MFYQLLVQLESTTGKEWVVYNNYQNELSLLFFFLLLSLQFQCSISTIIFKKLGVTAGRVFLQTNGCSNSVRLSQRVFDKFATSWNHMSRAPASFTSLLPGYFLQILPLFYVWTVVHAILSSAITQRAGKKTTAAAKKLAL